MLDDFQKTIETPTDRLGQSGVDALLLSAAMLTILAFALPESETEEGGGSAGEQDPFTSWVFSTKEDRLN